MIRTLRGTGMTLGVMLLTALVLTPANASAQINNNLNLGFNGGTWSGEDYLNTQEGIGLDASFLFGVGQDFRLGPVVEYGNFAFGSGGDRIQGLDLGVEGRFVDQSRRWGVDPYVGVRLAYGTQTSDSEGRDLSASGLAAQAAAGFYFPLGAIEHTGDLSVGIRSLSLGDWTDGDKTVNNSSGTGFYWFVKVGIAFGFGS